MFPGRFEGWLDDDFAELPLVKEPETDIASKRVDGVRMDLHRCQRAVLAKTVDIRIGVLKRGNWTDGQKAKVEIVPAADKGAQLGPLGVTGGQSLESGAA